MRSFELLLSCCSSVANQLKTCHLQELQGITQALLILPLQSSLVIDPTITSTSLIFLATAAAASVIATDSEISPEIVERLLLHSLCLLKLSKRCHIDSGMINSKFGNNSGKIGNNGNNEDGDNNMAFTHKLAGALPGFITASINSLNSNDRGGN